MKILKLLSISLSSYILLGNFLIADVICIYNKSGHDLSLKKIQARAYKIKLLKPVNWSYLKDTEFSTGDSKVIVVKNEEGIFVEPIAFDYRADSDNPILILENGTEKSEDIKVELLSNEDIVTQGNYSVSQQYVVPEQKIQDISEEWLGLCDKLIVISDVKKDTSEEESSANLFGSSLNFLTRLFGF